VLPQQAIIHYPIMDLLPTNFDVLSIPGFYIMALLPHAYALNIATAGKPTKWDNRNPRSTEIKANLQKRLPPIVWEKYQRAESASSNAFENFPFFAAAIIVGRMAGLDQETMNKFAVSFLLARAGHTFSYVLISNQKYTYVRTLFYFYTVGLGVQFFMKAAKSMK